MNGCFDCKHIVCSIDRNINTMRNHPECSNEHRDFDRYLEYMHGQVRELCENYGKIDIFLYSPGDMPTISRKTRCNVRMHP